MEGKLIMAGKIVASKANKAIARHIMAAFGGRQPSVARLTSDDGTFFVDVATTKDCPTAGVNSLSTIGLSDVPLFQPDGTPFTETRIELAGACHSRFDNMANMLFYTSYYIKTRRWLCCPDVVLEDVLTKFGYKGELRHLYFEEPFLWDGFDNLDLADKKVAWLYAIPISENERAFIEGRSFVALDRKWQDDDVDIFDLSRRSAI